MSKKCDQVGASDETRNIEMHKNKREPIAASWFSLPTASFSPFPYRLMEIINWCESKQAYTEGVSKLMGWSPNGKLFTINNTQKLSTHVLRRFFKDSKFDSFRRRLYRWGFKQVNSKIGSRSPGDISFYVNGFERDDQHSCSKIKVLYSTRERDERRHKSLE
jgi:hypothetical protein